MLLLKFILLMCSMMGYILYFSQRYHIKIEFMPAVLCAAISNLMFLGGILNFMPEITVCIFVAGYLLLYLCIRIQFKLNKRELFLCAMFVLILIYFSALLRGTHFIRYDNFSHWAVVVKDMLKNDRMPNFEDSIIMFQSYPLGSALFIYYICKIIGTTDACYIWAQVLMELSFIFCLAAYIKKENRFIGVFVIAIFSTYALTVNISIYELLVDTLLPLAGLAAFSAVYFYRKYPIKAIICLGILSVLIVNIKNSGMFFYLICILVLCVCCWDYIRMHKMQFFIIDLLIPILSLFIWKKHVKLVFSDGLASKHSMSLENYKHIVTDKCGDEVFLTTKNMLSAFISPQSDGLKLLLVSTLLIGLFAILYHILNEKKKELHSLKMIGMVWGIMILYQISLWGMYVFSMAGEEAIILGGYTRYMSSVIVFIFGILTIYILENVEIKSRSCKCFLAAICILSGYLLIPLQNINSVSSLYRKPIFENTTRYTIQKMKEKYHLPDGKRYLIYSNSENLGYLHYLGRYEFWTTGMRTIDSIEQEDMEELFQKYDYFIVLGEDTDIRQKLQELGYQFNIEEKNLAISLR